MGETFNILSIPVLQLNDMKLFILAITSAIVLYIETSSFIDTSVQNTTYLNGTVFKTSFFEYPHHPTSHTMCGRCYVLPDVFGLSADCTAS
ncbi:hypothetical protein BDV27DRAFT_132736 [Aspergillus caelatus]|uniref:Uncharacterized protein n=1 Tax=Aspergillus caelatus TaxID=61420 RepID=A0A5N6ZW88_9EURO|nr:uncharacterized protein BDV27DRAFT_132736 [Aspergillus caelatus]KAE8361645.1 hypothetical protein BDV27DRAFT_132736 [Aspergillus caelatus]